MDDWFPIFKRAINCLGLKHQVIAKRCGIADPAIVASWMHKGRSSRRPSVDSIMKICKGFGLRPDHLLIDGEIEKAEQLILKIVHEEAEKERVERLSGILDQASDTAE